MEGRNGIHSYTVSVPKKYYGAMMQWTSETQGLVASTSYARQGSNLLAHQDIIESLCIQQTVSLIQMLACGNFLECAKAWRLLLKLAKIFDTKEIIVDVDLAQQLEKNETFAISQFFAMIAKPLSYLCIGIVMELESLYLCSELRARPVALEVSVVLMSENSTMFVEQDHMASIWNLSFLLTSAKMARGRLTERLLAGLGSLHTVFGCVNIDLTCNILRGILCLPSKSPAENKKAAEAANNIVDCVAKQGDITYINSIMQVFYELLHDQGEDSLILGLETLERFLAVVNDNKEVAVTSGTPRFCLEFLVRVSPFVVRLSSGSSVALTSLRAASYILALQKIHGSILKDVNSYKPSEKSQTAHGSSVLSVMVVALLLSPNRATAVCRRILHRYAFLNQMPGVAEEMEKYESSMLFDSSDAGTPFHCAAGPDMLKSSRLYSLVKAFSKHCEAPNIRLFMSTANSLIYVGAAQKQKRLLLLNAWADGDQLANPLILNPLVSLLSGSDPVVGVLAANVIASVAPHLNIDEHEMFIKQVGIHLSGLLESYVTDLQTPPLPPKFMLSTSETKSLKIVLEKHRDIKAKRKDNISPESMIAPVLNIVAVMPLEFLALESRQALLELLCKLAVGHSSPFVRYEAITVLNRCWHLWQEDELRRMALASLIICVADVSPKCIAAACLGIQGASESDMKYNNISIVCARHADDFASHILEKRMKALHFLVDVLVREHFSTVCAFLMKPTTVIVASEVAGSLQRHVAFKIHSPAMYLILFTRWWAARGNLQTLGTEVSEALIGAMRPRLSGYDSIVELYETLLTTVYCCVHGEDIIFPVIKLFLQNSYDVLAQSSTSQTATGKQTAFRLLRLLLPLNIPHYAEGMAAFYLSFALNVLGSPTLPSALIIEATKFVEMLLCVCPGLLGDEFTNIRDSLRALVAHDDLQVAAAAFRAMPLVYANMHMASEPNVPSQFVDYLAEELKLAGRSGKDWEVEADPLVSSLDAVRRKMACRNALDCLASVQQGSQCRAAINAAQPFLSHPDPMYREAALGAVLSQVTNLSMSEASPYLWLSLPLMGDASGRVRAIWAAFLTSEEKLNKARTLKAVIIPRQPQLSVFHKFKRGLNTFDPAEGVHLIDTLFEAPRSDDLKYFSYDKMQFFIDSADIVDKIMRAHGLKKATARFHLDAAFVQQLRTVCEKRCGVVSDRRADFVLYTLQHFIDDSPGASSKSVLSEDPDQVSMPRLRSPSVAATAQIALALFCILTPTDVFSLVIEALVHGGSQPLRASTRILVESAAIGLGLIGESSESRYSEIMSRYTSLPILSESDMFVLQFLAKATALHSPSVGHSMIQRYVKYASSKRLPGSTRIQAVKLVARFARQVSQDEVPFVVATLSQMLDDVDDHALSKVCEEQIAYIVESSEVDRTHINQLLERTHKLLTVSDAQKRRHGISRLRIIARFVPLHVMLPITVRLVADPDPKIAEAAMTFFIDGSAPQLLEAFKGVIDEIVAELVPKHEKETVAVATSVERPEEDEEFTVPLEESDPGNMRHDNSARYRRLLSLYGLDKMQNQRAATENETRMFAIENFSSRLRDRFLTQIVRVNPDQGRGLLSELAEGLNGDLHDTREHSVILHSVRVLGVVLVATRGVMETLPVIMKLFECANRCFELGNTVRKELFENSEIFVLLNPRLRSELPLTSPEKLKLVEKYQAIQDSAAVDIQILERQNKVKEEIEQKLQKESFNLGQISTIHHQALTSVIDVVETSTEVAEENILTILKEFVRHLGAEHRAVRRAAAQGVIRTLKGHFERFGKDSKFALEAAKVVNSAFDAIIEDGSRRELRRRRVDYLEVITALVAFCDTTLRVKVVDLLLRLWDDTDAIIRVFAIRTMLQFLKDGLHEAISCTLPGGHVNLSSEVSKRMSDGRYASKDDLHILLNWLTQHRPEVVKEPESPSPVEEDKPS